jgi:hypothetical protein
VEIPTLSARNYTLNHVNGMKPWLRALVRGYGLQLEQHRSVDLLDIDAAVRIGSKALASWTSLRAATSGSA